MNKCCLIAAECLEERIDRTSFRTTKPVRQASIAGIRAARVRRSFQWMPASCTWRCAGCGATKRRRLSKIDFISWGALQDQGKLVHTSHKVIRWIELDGHDTNDGVPSMLCRSCGAHGATRLQDLRKVCKGRSARGRSVFNHFCAKKRHPTRKTHIVGDLSVQSAVGEVDLPPARASGKVVACLPCGASCVDDVSNNTLADHAFEELDVPP